MEELRSTEILDKEIQADARQKVETILKSAEEECKKLKEGVAERVENAKNDKKAYFDKKLKAAERDMDAALPLEKSRFKVSFIESQIMQSVNEYLKALPVEKHIELLLSGIDEESELIADKKLNAFVYGLELKTVKAALSKKIGSNLLSCEKTEFCKYVLEDEIGLENNEGIILETEDKTFRCRLTLVQIFSRLFDKYRAEFASALFENKIEAL